MKGDRIKYKDGYKYQIAETYCLHVGILPDTPITTDYLSLDLDGLLTIAKGYAFDGASGPTFDSKSSMRGALIHDALYQLMRLGLIPETYREKADDLLESICIEDGMFKVRAYIWERMVRCFASGCAKRGSEKPVLTAP